MQKRRIHTIIVSPDSVTSLTHTNSAADLQTPLWQLAVRYTVIMPAFPIPTFDAFTLAAVAEEWERLIVGARVQKIQQPTSSEIILAVYGKSGAQRILLCADPKNFRAHLTQLKRDNPLNAPFFCAACRKYLDGAIITGVSMPRFDRVLIVTFRTHDGESVRLVAELMGRNTNVILTSGAGIVRAALRPTPPDAPRSLRPGETYANPPGYTDRIDPIAALTSGEIDALPTDSEAAKEAILTQFSGIGKFGLAETMARSVTQGITPAAALRELLEEAHQKRFAPHSVTDETGKTVGVWSLLPCCVPEGLRHSRESISVALDTFYAAATERGATDDAKTALAKILRTEIAYRKKELASADATLREAERADEYERTGNNLLAALYRIEKGMTEISAPDLYSEDGAEILIALDPKKTPHENAEAYFARARKSRDAAIYALRRKEEVADQMIRLQSLSVELDSAAIDDFPGIQARLIDVVGVERSAGSSPTERKRPLAEERPFKGFRIRTFTIGDYTLLVGESADANDHLTTRVASPSDWWFHVRSAPGAHGVLRTGGKPDRVPESVLRRAAEIVAARSTAVKHSGVVAVDIIEKRYVRKPRGAKPGLVTYEKERTIDVTPQL